MTLRRSWLALSIIVVLAALLRFWMLGKESLWLDELVSWHFAVQGLSTALRAEPTNPPLYYVALHFWIRLFGASEAALRSLSVLPSIATVWLLYSFARRLASPPAALLAAAYLAVSSFQIEYAQEARVPAWLSFLILAASFQLWTAWDAPDKRKRLVRYAAYSALCVLCLYSHFISVFYLAAQGLHVLISKRKQLAWFAAAMGAAILAFAPWLIQMLRAASAGGQSRRYLLLKLPQTYFSFLFGDSLIPLDEQAVQNPAQVLMDNWHILAIAILAAAILAARLPRWLRRPEQEGLGFALNMSVTPVLLAFLVSFRIMLFDERYLLPSTPFVCLLVSVAAVDLVQSGPAARPWRSWKAAAQWLTVGAYGVLVLLSLYKYYFDPRFGKEQWREAVSYMDSYTTDRNAAMIVFEPDYLHFCYQYYTKAPLADFRITPRLGRQLEADPYVLMDALQGRQFVWLVRSHFHGERVLQLLQLEFDEVERRFFPKAKGIDVRRFERRAPPDAVRRP